MFLDSVSFSLHDYSLSFRVDMKVLQKIAEEDVQRTSSGVRATGDIDIDIQKQILNAVKEPVRDFFFKDADPVAYIDDKISNMDKILKEWPDIDFNSEEHKAAQVRLL